ncbi:hypothetical protein [Aeromicrobium sp. CTD01-1L150]|uniref:hypothetical protein n=1 Tax=Aeromicrobium sp. CTD01-1L150 TaxID=3341830 RepID=UPI0035BFBF4F
MSFAAWIAIGIGVGAALSIVFADPTITGFGAAFGIMAGILWGRRGAPQDETDDS